MATEAARLDPERRDLAQEFPGGEMGRKGMRREEGEAGAAGMGWCLRAAGERLLPSPHHACVGPRTQPGPGLSLAEGKGCRSSEQRGSLSFSPVQLPFLLSPSANLRGLLGEQRPCYLPCQERGFSPQPALSPGPPPGARQFPSMLRSAEGPLLVWGGERRQQCHLLKQASPGHPI